MPSYLCPVCAAELVVNLPGKGYSCSQKHHFDLAKEGYLNLLPVQHKHSKDPGDNKAMLQARQAFLAAGYYQVLADTLVQVINQYLPRHETSNILDLGCGEGYYSRHLASHSATWEHTRFHGLDIAKYAVASAAKKQKHAHFVVASTHRLPYANDYFDLIFRVFAPSNPGEICRVLKTDGLLLTVTPGPRHLWQIKEFIYAEVTAHAETAELPDNFNVIHTQRCQYTITPVTADRMTLLHMTPFAWRANEAVQQRIEQANDLQIDTDFVITLASPSS